MNSKKIIAGLLSFVIAATTTATPLSGTISGVLDNFSLSASAETSGDYEYSILDDGTVEITKYKGSDIEVEIPSDIDNKKVTSIGNCAFINDMYLKSVTIPEGVTNIGEGAFSSCQYLANVTIPEGVKTIGKDAFQGSPNLASITLPNGVTSIGSNAFYNCASLTDITIPDSVTDFGAQVFDGTKWLENKQKENPLVIINNILIDGKACEGVVVIPDGVKKITDYAFGGCENLTSVVIPNSVTNIGNQAFVLCSNLKSITIPNSITNIPQDTFTLCQNLKTVYYFGTEEEWNNITIEDSYCPLITAHKYYNMSDYNTEVLDDGTIEIINYNGSAAELEIPPEINGKKVTSIGDDAFGNRESLTSITIPNSVTNIGDYAFWCCKNLTSITIPSSVESIGDSALYGCNNLTCITVDESNKNYSSSDGVLFNKDKTALIQYPVGKKETSYSVPNSVTSIEYDAFAGCENLTSVTLANGITSIGNDAFWKCTNLTSVTIPDSVTSIGEEALYGCDNLTCITVDENNENYSSSDGVLFNKDKTMLIQYPAGNKRTSYTIPSSVTNIGSGAFVDCTNLSSITIPNSITNIVENTFTFCENLKTVYYFGTEEEWNSITIEDLNNEALKNAHKYYNISDYDTEVLDDGTLEITDYYGSATEIEIPPEINGKKVTSIGERAFLNCSDLTSVTIPNGVTSIGDQAFRNCSDLTSVTIPNGVTSIGDSAFDNCSALTNINIPGSVTSIGDSAFSSCSGLTSVEIPGNVKSIGDGTFGGCENLTTVLIPNSVTSIGNDAFDGCENLTNVTIPDSVTSIGDDAFWGCSSLTSITIPDSVTNIGESPFGGCENLTDITVDENNENYSSSDGVLFNKDKTTLIQYPAKNEKTSYTIPSSVTNIANYAFYYCEILTSITLPNGVTTIGDSAFEGCVNIPSINLPNSVTSIGDSAFYYCESLTSIVIPNNITTIGYSAFDNCSSLTSVTIPDSVTSIGESAFGYCASLTSITLPKDLISIGEAAFKRCTSLTEITIPSKVESIGNEAFNICNNLKGITVDENNANYSSSDGVLFNKDKTTLIQYPAGDKTTSYIIPNSVTNIAEYAFWSCANLTSVAIPDGVTSIGDIFRNCTSLTSITIPDSVTSIGESAFNGCTSLTSITIPNSVKSIGYCAFIDCDNLKSVCYPGTEDDWKSIEIGEYNDAIINAHKYYNFKDYDTEVLDDGTLEIRYRGSATKLEIPSEIDGKKVTRIGAGAFSGCKTLTSVTIPDSVTSIGESPFGDCENLTDITVDENNANYSSSDGVLFNKDKTTLIQYPAGNKRTSYTIPNSVTNIAESAFYKCTKLTSITIPNSVTSIGDWGFEYCSSLTSITIPNSVTSIGKSAFNGCDNLTDITVDENNANYSSSDGVLFNKDKTTLIKHPIKNERTSYTIPSSVTSIGDSAFNSCTNLTSVKIPKSVTSIGSWAFLKCSSLKSITIPNGVKNIGGWTFDGCTSLTSVTIPNSVKNIEYYAFIDCDNLKSVYYSGTEDEWYNIGISYFNDPLTNANRYYNMSSSVLHQKKLDNTAVRFLYLADIDDVTKANKADVTFKGDRIAVGTESITKAYRSVIAGGKKVTAPEGKCYLVTSPMYLNEVSSEWAAEFALYEDDAVTKQSQGICKIG